MTLTCFEVIDFETEYAFPPADKDKDSPVREPTEVLGIAEDSVTLFRAESMSSSEL